MANGNRKRRDHGQSLVEFALMAPFLLLLLTGVVEIGRVIFYTVAVNNAAMAGAGFGAQNTITMKRSDLITTTATSDASSVPGMTVTPSYGCTCDEGMGTSCSYPIPPQSACTDISCPNGGQVVQCVQVLTHADITPLFEFPGLPRRYPANGRAVMRVRK
jgi:TadE-like protein